jgi:hypothetical protein
MKHPFFRSVKSQLALLVMISLLPVLAIFVYTALDRRSKVIEDAKANALQVVRDVAFQQKQVAETTRHLLMTVTKVPDVRNQNAPACNKLFGELLNENPVYADIFSANADGLIFSSGRPFMPYNVSKRKFFGYGADKGLYSGRIYCGRDHETIGTPICIPGSRR